MIGGRLLQRRLRAAERPEPAGFREQRIDGEGEHAQEQAPAAGSAQRLHQHHPHHETRGDHVVRRAAEFPAGLRGLADVRHQHRSPRAKVATKQSEVIPGNAVERRALGAREDQEGERQHQRDQKIEVFRVELGVADEEAQRELLVDAEQNGRRGRGDEHPAPRAAQASDARDLRFLHVGGGAMRIVEHDPFGLVLRGGGAERRHHRSRVCGSCTLRTDHRTRSACRPSQAPRHAPSSSRRGTPCHPQADWICRSRSTLRQAPPGA